VEVNGIAAQIDPQALVEPKHGVLPSIWTIGVSSSALASPRSNSALLGSLQTFCRSLEGYRLLKACG
jgi:hypothetical protein